MIDRQAMDMILILILILIFFSIFFSFFLSFFEVTKDKQGGGSCCLERERRRVCNVPKKLISKYSAVRR